MSTQTRAYAARAAIPLGEWLMLAVMLATAIYVWIESASLSASGAVWPRILAGTFVAALVLEVVTRVRKNAAVLADGTGADSATEVNEGSAAAADAPRPADSTHGRWWALYTAAFIVFAVAANLFGFLTAVPVFVVLFMVTHGYARRPVVVLLTTLILTAALYVVFDGFANLPLTRGVWLRYDLGLL